MMTPVTEQELSDAIRDADGRLGIIGGGTRGIISGPRLSTRKLSGITLYEPGALTLVAKAGTPLAEIENALAKENQRLPFEPMDHRTVMGTDGDATIGGVVAGNISGPRRIQAGACRDSLIGVRFVDGAGTILKNGGRVMKNVTGYDLVKLMAGAHGTLGVLSEVSFKLLPDTAAAAVILINGQSVGAAVDSMSKALGSPFEVSGAAFTPSGVDGHPVTMIRIEGFADSVTYRAAELEKLLADGGDISVEKDPDRITAGWAWVRDVETFKDAPGDLWRVSVKPSDAPKFVEQLGSSKYLLDWGGGLIWALTPEGFDLRAKLGEIAGHATLVRGSGQARFHPEPAPLAKIAKGLREKFDPRGILNPGLMG